MMEVYSNSFWWNKAQGDKLIAKLQMGDLKCKKQVNMNFNLISQTYELFVVQMFQVLF